MGNSRSVCICSAKKDKRYIEELLVHCSPMRRALKVDLRSVWDVVPGTNVKDHICASIESSHVIVAMITANFVACCDPVEELIYSKITQCYQSGTAVIPVFMSRVYLPDDNLFMKLMGYPRYRDKCVLEMNRDDAWFECASMIRNVVSSK